MAVFFRSMLRLGFASVRVVAFGLALWARPALADPASDEANRQSMMADMRASAAANDSANFNSLQRNQADYARDHSGSSSSASGSGGGGSSAGFTGMPASRGSIPIGPRSIVATYSFTIRRQESPLALAARLEQEAVGGSALSAFNLGRVEYTGFDGLPRDDAKARRWFGEAARLGHPGGQSQYGYMLHDGIGGPADVAEGIGWTKKAADQGDAYGEALYGFYLVKARAAEPGTDLSAAIAYLTRAADKGQMLAQATLGTLVYEYGVGTAVDWDKAAHYARLAADQNYATAQRELGRMYLTGRGVAKDEAAGVSLLRKAAAHGDGEAMALLGQLAMTGQGMTQDDTTGATWFKQAADAGDVHSQTIYGSLLIMGQGVEKNEVEGVRYTRRAAEAGDVDGQLNLAKDYYFGHGVAKDLAQSLVWFRKAAAQGNDQAIGALRDDAALIAAAAAH